MPEWVVEVGIGETRAALIDGGEIIEARVELSDSSPAGTILTARLVSNGVGGRNAIARDAAGLEYLLPRGAPGVTVGAGLNIEVTRQTIPGGEPWKRPLALSVGSSALKLSDLRERLGARQTRLGSSENELEGAGWNDLVEEARSGVVAFRGGELRIASTPAMTLIDVDGYLAPDELATIGARHAAAAIRRLDIGGSIGIDLPTTQSKSARLGAASAIDDCLPKPFERTAVNGFGFVQIIRPRSRPSFIELAADRAAFEARDLLRRITRQLTGAGTIVAHPLVIQVIEQHGGWTDELSRRVGGLVSLRSDPRLPMSGGYAEPSQSQ